MGIKPLFSENIILYLPEIVHMVHMVSVMPLLLELWLSYVLIRVKEATWTNIG